MHIRYIAAIAAAGLTSAVSADAAFACGAYFGKRSVASASETRPASRTATTSSALFNKSTKMIIARQGDVSTVTMSADYRGDPKEFAIVIAVPTVLTREQIKIGDAKLIAMLDRMTVPKLVQTYDPAPCPIEKLRSSLPPVSKSAPGRVGSANRPTTASPPGTLGVTVEAQYAVGEYDVSVLSAEQGGGLRQWLNQEGYEVPTAAEPILATYISEGLKFFVAKVNLTRQQDKAYAELSPLQLTYTSQKFWAPLRLSTINAEGPQDMFIYALTARGRVEAVNFPNRAFPAFNELPPFVARDFNGFYAAAFDTLANGTTAVIEAVERSGFPIVPKPTRPGSADLPSQARFSLTDETLDKLGAGWGKGKGQIVLTRLHLRYDRNVKSDLILRETDLSTPQSSTFSIAHPYRGNTSCPAGVAYQKSLSARGVRETASLSRLTGWSSETIRRKSGAR